ncbi:MAG: single-stranded-DNA-specific exonuclease RecJ [Thermodesulfovibrionales bacterium]|nr:single-stranded-DNA-specific exonuclease RecJ [Thermodesulfovibrionales bacterium]
MRKRQTNQRWLINKTNDDFLNYVSRISGLSAISSQILVNRGIKTPEQIRYFLNRDTFCLSDPFLIDGISKANQRIKNAIVKNERILISGDYDADGLTATAILYEGLRYLNADVYYFIPHRINDGYGFGLSAVRYAKQIGASLVITVDSGITSFEALSYAKSQGLDVIVTDHHEPFWDETNKSIVLPEAYAIINPKIMSQSEDYFNIKELSGAGVAFKLVQSLIDDKDKLMSLLDLVAIGTSADVVSVIGENRMFLQHGMKLIKEGGRKSIAVLKDISGIKDGDFRSYHLNFILNPRINAPGRVDDPTDVVRMLVSDSFSEVERIARWTHEMNYKRQQIEEMVLREALQQIENMEELGNAIVVSGKKWHLGVVGIVASRLSENYSLPSFVFSVEDGIAKGSARSFDSFNVLEGLKRCSHLLDRFGGHKQAAGITMKADRIEDFRALMNEVVCELKDKSELQTVLVDSLVDLKDINTDLIREISLFEPFGNGNKEPLFGSKLLEVLDYRIVGNNHLRLNVRQKGKIINCIAFDMASEADNLAGRFIDALFRPTLNEQYNNQIQLQIRAIRPSTGGDT